MFTSIKLGFYLACSWLWCLGGFFPLILSRDYGWPALLAFTLFNVGGAMAMGFYFKNRDKQQAFQIRHKTTISLFSYITIAYQIFFIAWLSYVLASPYILPLVLAIVFVMFLFKQEQTHLAILVFAISMALMVWYISLDWPLIKIDAQAPWPHAILPLAIGFILSPYLDITFHRAFSDSPYPKLSFAFGFGVLFLSLLAFVFMYAGSLSQLFFEGGAVSAIAYPIVTFVVLQVAFTLFAHTRELLQQNMAQPKQLIFGLGLCSLLFLLILGVFKEQNIAWINSPLEETLYKSFLFFYSLVFPSYLLFSKSMRVFWAVLIICTPLYALGFLIDLEYSYSLSIGVGFMLICAVIYAVKNNANLQRNIRQN